MASNRDGTRHFPTHLHLLVFIVPFAVYLTTLSNGFVYDDIPQVTSNPWIRSLGNIGQIFSSSHWQFRGVESNIYRPFFHLLLMVEFFFFGLKPWGYHLVNALLHALNTLILFKIAARFIPVKAEVSFSGEGFSDGASGKGGRSLPARVLSRPFTLPFIASLFFALTPINTEAVSWVSSIPELTYTFFFLLAFLFHLRSSDYRDGGVSVKRRTLPFLFFTLALFCKEPAFMFVPFIWCYEVLFRGSRGEADVSLSRRLKAASRVVLPYFIIALVFLALRGVVIGGLMHHAQIDLPAGGVILNVFPLFAAYLGKLIVPIGLNAVYEFYSVTSVGDARFLVSLGVTALYFFAFIALLRRGERLAVFTLLWIALPLLPVLYVPALATVAFADRYMYLPSAGFAILLTITLVWLLRHSVNAFKGGAWLVLTVTLLILILYLGGTLSRVQVWRSNLTLWTDTAVKSPMNPDVRYNLGWTYHELGMVAEAEAEYRETLRLKPSIEEARFNLAVIYLERGEVRRAYRELLTLKNLNPKHKEATRLTREIEANNSGWLE